MAKLFLLSAIKKAHRLHQSRVVVAANAVQVKNQSQRTKEQNPMKLEPPLPKKTQMTTPKKSGETENADKPKRSRSPDRHHRGRSREAYSRQRSRDHLGRSRSPIRYPRTPSDRAASERGPSDRAPSDRAPSDRAPSDRAPSSR